MKERVGCAPLSPKRGDMEEILRHYATMHEAFITFSHEHPGQHLLPGGGIRFPVAQDKFDAALICDLRYTDFFVSAYTMQNVTHVSIREKRFVEPSVCFHIAPASKQADIVRSGILPGIATGCGPHFPQYSDSVYYIYVSLTAKAAIEWAQRLPTREDRVMFEIRLHRLRCRVFEDPCSSSGGTCVGYILETICVPPRFLGAPVLIPVGAEQTPTL